MNKARRSSAAAAPGVSRKTKEGRVCLSGLLAAWRRQRQLLRRLGAPAARCQGPRSADSRPSVCVVCAWCVSCVRAQVRVCVPYSSRYFPSAPLSLHSLPRGNFGPRQGIIYPCGYAAPCPPPSHRRVCCVLPLPRIPDTKTKRGFLLDGKTPSTHTHIRAHTLTLRHTSAHAHIVVTALPVES